MNQLFAKRHLHQSKPSDAVSSSRIREGQHLDQSTSRNQAVSVFGVTQAEPTQTQESKVDPVPLGATDVTLGEHDTEGNDQAYPALRNVAFEYSLSVPPSIPARASTAPSRRGSERKSCELQLEFTEETHFFTGLTQDISQGGIFIATYHVRAVGSRLKLAFDLPDGTRVETNGTVKWIRESRSESVRPGMGIAFESLPEAAATAIGRFCLERPPLYFEL